LIATCQAAKVPVAGCPFEIILCLDLAVVVVVGPFRSAQAADRWQRRATLGWSLQSVKLLPSVRSVNFLTERDFFSRRPPLWKAQPPDGEIKLPQLPMIFARICL
jgi:hypothetical protein